MDGCSLMGCSLGEFPGDCPRWLGALFALSLWEDLVPWEDLGPAMVRMVLRRLVKRWGS